MLRVAAVCAAALALAGCPTLPTPFAHQGPVTENNLLELPSATAVRVVPPALPADVARPMADAAVDALVAAGIPASSDALSNSFVLRGEVLLDDPDASESGGIAIEWRLIGTDGKPVGKIEQLLPGTRDSPDVARLQVAARDAAREVAAYFDRRARLATVDGATEAAVAGAEPALYFEGVTGAPGDGNEALARSLLFILRKSGAPVVDSPDQATHRLSGTVEAKPQPGGMSDVSVVWRITDREGRELGKVSQRNPVKSSLIENRWGELAFVVSDAASDGVLDALASVAQPPDRRPLSLPPE